MNFFRHIFWVLILFSGKILFAQFNLVPNPGFDVYDTCPNNYAQIRYAIPWFQPNAPWLSYHTGSTDYFNQCSSIWNVSVPSNIGGFQNAHSGNAYAGFACYIWPTDTQWKEYLEVKLNSVLDSNIKYCISFYVSLSNNEGNAPTSAIGAYFSNDSALYYSPGYYTFNVNPQIVNPYDSIISDTAGWTVIKGILNPVGGEQYITIGNFWDPPYNYMCIGSPCEMAFYYIDDVSVVALPEIDAGISDTVCRGDSALLTGTLSEYWTKMDFAWTPQSGLNDLDSLHTYASPDSTTTYYFTVSCETCAVPCLEDIIDSVTVYVIQPSIVISAGADTVIALGDSVQLGSVAQAGVIYQWQPATGLSATDIAQPWASPANTTTYFLTAFYSEDTCSFVIHDSVTITIGTSLNDYNSQQQLIIPSVLYSTDIWVIGNIPKKTQVMIFDEMGRIVFITPDYKNDFSGTQLSSGIYYYSISTSSGNENKGKLVKVE